METIQMKKLFVPLLLAIVASGIAAAQGVSSGQFMYIGTLDKKLLVIDENKEDIVDQIQLGGIPRATALSADKKQIFIFTTQMLLETVDLETRKVVSSFSLADVRSRPRIQATAPDRINLGGAGGGGGSRYSGLA